MKTVHFVADSPDAIPADTGSTSRNNCLPMNSLLIGNADKTEKLLQIPKRNFLLIDDGEIADAFLMEYPRARVFDPDLHSFNPLKNIDYRGARNFAATVYTASPEGTNTLTVRNGKRQMAKHILLNPTRLDKLHIKSKDPALIEVLATIEDLLLSPVLTKVLCQPTNFSFKGSIVAKIDRAKFGDFDAFILASLLIGQFKGQIIVPDFGFYGRDIHTSLIRENRLTAGLNSLSECSTTLQQALLGIKDKTVYRTSLEDAQRLVPYLPETFGKTSAITDLRDDQWFSS
jgi:hypothetical protein